MEETEVTESSSELQQNEIELINLKNEDQQCR